MASKKVLILSVAQGGGHISAAQALVAAHAKFGGDFEVLHHEALKFTGATFQKIYRDGYFKIVNCQPNLLGLWYDEDDKPWGTKRFRLFEKINSFRLLRMIWKYKPDLIVCTHPWPAELISNAKEKGQTSVPLMIVTTDFDVHALWLCRYADIYTVASEQTRLYLQRVGVDPSKIIVSGIPVNPAFAEQNDKLLMRAKHGLDAELPTILLSAGGYGLGPVDEVLQCLMKVKRKTQIVVVCGRNQELKGTIEAVALQAGNHHLIKVIGFTDEMSEIMAACDIIVGKSGGLTTSEAITQGLIFVVVNPIPGQEVRNANHLSNAGAAVRVNDLEVLDLQIDDLLSNPARLTGMQGNARAMARPQAAQEIVKLFPVLMLPAGSSQIWKPQKSLCKIIGKGLDWLTP